MELRAGSLCSIFQRKGIFGFQNGRVIEKLGQIKAPQTVRTNGIYSPKISVEKGTHEHFQISTHLGFVPDLFSFGLNLFIGCEQHDLTGKWPRLGWGIGAVTSTHPFDPNYPRTPLEKVKDGLKSNF